MNELIEAQREAVVESLMCISQECVRSQPTRNCLRRTLRACVESQVSLALNSMRKQAGSIELSHFARVPKFVTRMRDDGVQRQSDACGHMK